MCLYTGERCPFCNCPLDSFNREGVFKHLAVCETRNSGYKYSDNPPGARRVHNPIRTPGKDASDTQKR